MRSRLLRGAARSGALSLTPVTADVGFDPETVAALRRRLPWVTDVAVYFGPPRANAKPVMALMAGDSVKAVAKVGAGPLTRQLVVNEAEALLDQEEKGKLGYTAPRVVDWFNAGDAAVLVLSAFDLRGSTPTSAGGSLRSEWLRVARGIAQPEPPQALAECSWWHQTQERLSALERPAGSIRRLQHQLDAHRGATVQPAASHGDFTAWNARRLSWGWAVWDWERYTRASIWGFDILHWELYSRSGTGLDAACRSVVQQQRSILLNTGIPADAGALVAFLYLTDLAIRFHADKQPTAASVESAALAAAEILRRG